MPLDTKAFVEIMISKEADITPILQHMLEKGIDLSTETAILNEIESQFRQLKESQDAQVKVFWK